MTIEARAANTHTSCSITQGRGFSRLHITSNNYISLQSVMHNCSIETLTLVGSGVGGDSPCTCPILRNVTRLPRAAFGELAGNTVYVVTHQTTKNLKLLYQKFHVRNSHMKHYIVAMCFRYFTSSG